MKNVLREQGQPFFQSYEELIERGQVTVNADVAGAYYENQNEKAFWGLLLNAGMVTIEEEIREDLYKVRVTESGSLERISGFDGLLFADGGRKNRQNAVLSPDRRYGALFPRIQKDLAGNPLLSRSGR